MAGNANPIFQRLGDVNTAGTAGTTMPGTLTTAAADYTGVSANNILIFTSDATNGSWIERIRFKANTSSNNSASVARIYINNGSTHTTATNNTLYGEVTLPATTASATTATIEIDYPMGFPLNPAFAIYVGVGTTVAGWQATAIGGPY